MSGARLTICALIPACGWRIVIPPKITQVSPSCYHTSMRNLAVLFIHLIVVLARLLGPGGVRAVVAESLFIALLNSPRSRRILGRIHVWSNHRVLVWSRLLLGF